MISQNKLLTCVYEYIAETVGCTVNQLKSDETIFVMNPIKKEKYIKILGIGDANIISLSEDVYAHVKKLLAGKNRDELFESELIYGQTLRYVPDIKQMIPFTYPKEYAFEILESLDIKKFGGLRGLIIRYFLMKKEIRTQVLFYMPKRWRNHCGCWSST